MQMIEMMIANPDFDNMPDEVQQEFLNQIRDSSVKVQAYQPNHPKPAVPTPKVQVNIKPRP